MRHCERFLRCNLSAWKGDCFVAKNAPRNEIRIKKGNLMNYGELRSNMIPDLLKKVVVLPIGSLEQHGHHLPMLTDSLINSEIIRRVQPMLDGEVIFLPLLWVGASDHHLGLPGPISISNDTYTHVLMDMVESLIHHGFRRIVLFNSHGGNGGPANNAIFQLQMKHRDLPDLWLVLVSWFQIAGEQIAQIASLQQKHVSHACELETSMILRIRPELVKMEAARGANIPFKSDFWSADSSGPSRVSVARTFEQTSLTGALGHPELATAEKGEALFAVAAHEFTAFIREFITWSEYPPH
jgi:creatinine amidohydrolase